jgi:transposase
VILPGLALAYAFCELYRNWEAKLSVAMRQTHVGGDKLFVDYARRYGACDIDRLTGEVRQTQIFVAVMGVSNFTYLEANCTWACRLDRCAHARLRGDRRRAAPHHPRQRQGRRH